MLFVSFTTSADIDHRKARPALPAQAWRNRNHPWDKWYHRILLQVFFDRRRSCRRRKQRGCPAAFARLTFLQTARFEKPGRKMARKARIAVIGAGIGGVAAAGAPRAGGLGGQSCGRAGEGREGGAG